MPSAAGEGPVTKVAWQVTPRPSASAANPDLITDRHTDPPSGMRCVSHLICGTLTETMHTEHPCEHTFYNQE